MLFWRILVIIFIILAIIGAILPGMPTTVFLILAAWAASKGWPAMDAWLLNHPKYGATLRAWRENGTVPRRAKWIASIMMLISAIIMLFTTAPWWVKVFTDVTMLIVAIWLWLRPEPSVSIKENLTQHTQDHLTQPKTLENNMHTSYVNEKKIIIKTDHNQHDLK